MTRNTLSNYKNINKTLLLLSISIFIFPFFIYIFKTSLPNLYSLLRCRYYSTTGNPCPFCGITTDIKNILTGNIFCYKYNLLSIPLLIFTILELCLRTILIKFSNRITKNIILLDIFYHLTIIIALFIYFILFFKLNLARF